VNDGPPALVSISLVTYNGMRWLDACLASALAQTHPAIEFVVLDNASTDDTTARLVAFQREHANVRLIQSPENLGFAAAHNRNLALARGGFVCLLNQDIILDPDFLKQAVGAFDGDPNIAAVQGKLYRLGPALEKSSILDTTGLRMLRNRRIVSRGQGEEDSGQFDQPARIFGADGPAPVFRASALDQVRVPRTRGGWEILDEDFFMYKEDVDLAWRLLLFGWDAVYTPSAVAWHARGAGASGQTARALARERRRLPGWIKCLSWGNQRLMQVKNEQGSLVARDLLHILWKELRAFAFLAIFETRCLAAVPRLARMLPAARRKRAFIMKHKKRGPADMAVWFQDG
jgi:GT2 family glycosyltransferase